MPTRQGSMLAKHSKTLERSKVWRFTVLPCSLTACRTKIFFAIRRNRAKDWWLRLVGSVGSANALNGFVGAPSKFEKKVDTGLLVAVIQASVIAAACSSGI